MLETLENIASNLIERWGKTTGYPQRALRSYEVSNDFIVQECYREPLDREKKQNKLILDFSGTMFEG